MLCVPDWYPPVVLDFEDDFWVAHEVAVLCAVVCDADTVFIDFFDGELHHLRDFDGVVVSDHHFLDGGVEFPEDLFDCFHRDLFFTSDGEVLVVASDEVDDLFLCDGCGVLRFHFYVVAFCESADVSGVGITFEAFHEFVESVSGYPFDLFEDFLGRDVFGYFFWVLKDLSACAFDSVF